MSYSAGMPRAVEAVMPLAQEWAEQVDYVINTVGAEHLAIGLDLVGGRSAIPREPSGYRELVAALNRITPPDNVRKVTGEQRRNERRRPRLPRRQE
jgi:microsomal dipeptidase-like Zn-dependent dipeptidase